MSQLQCGCGGQGFVQVHRLLPTGAVVETAEGDIGTAQQWQCAGCSAVYVVLQGRLVPSREAWE